ncbi:MAG: hypothetical protein O7C59_08110 [Rickettsia endosymbiont of Ixodes persulcatus]|nr:hypothetical protein [Rickettsia endosymbiont of Ixodes persulcatus]
MVVVESEGTHEHDGVAHTRVGFPEINKFSFEKNKFKNFKKESKCLIIIIILSEK